MVNDEVTIKKILLEAGVYSFGLAIVGNEPELLRMFKDDFDGLMAACQEGV